MPDSGYLVLPTALQRGQLARAEHINDRMTLVGAAFNKLPTERELKQGKTNIGVDSGAVNAYVVTQPYPIVAYQDGDLFLFRALHANTGASTVIVDGVGAVSLLRDNGDALQAGDIAAGGAMNAVRYHAASGTARVQGASAADLAASTVQAAAAQASASSAAGFATASQASAVASAASAALAATSTAALHGTSASSVAIGTGSKSFTTQTDKQFNVGGFVMIASASNVANYMFGQITAYSGSGLTVNVSVIGGSGTKADWLISIAGAQGATGATGPTGSGSGDVNGPGSATSGNVVTFNGTSGKTIQDSGVALGSMASQAASAVNISGGTVAGITDLAVADGGTGASTATNARSNLGLVIGSDVQAFSAKLSALANATWAADSYFLMTSASALSVAGISANAQTMLAAADFAAMRTALGLGTVATQDYTETTFTPVMRFNALTTGITYLFQYGKYIKIGNLVVIFISIDLTSNGSGVGNATIAGLPFAATADSSPGLFMLRARSGFSGLGGSLLGSVASGTTVIDLSQTSSTGETALTDTNITNNASIRVHGFYRI